MDVLENTGNEDLQKGDQTLGRSDMPTPGLARWSCYMPFLLSPYSWLNIPYDFSLINFKFAEGKEEGEEGQNTHPQEFIPYL